MRGSQAPRKLPAAEENVAAAKAFLEQAWCGRAVEYGQPEPADLTGACIYAAAFCRLLFGGTVRGGWHHIWLEVDGRKIDLTAAVGVNVQAAERLELANRYGPSVLSEFFQGANPDPYLDQPAFRRTADFRDTWKSVQPRVRDWARRFRAGDTVMS